MLVLNEALSAPSPAFADAPLPEHIVDGEYLRRDNLLALGNSGAALVLRASQVIGPDGSVTHQFQPGNVEAAAAEVQSPHSPAWLQEHCTGSLSVAPGASIAKHNAYASVSYAPVVGSTSLSIEKWKLAKAKGVTFCGITGLVLGQAGGPGFNFNTTKPPVNRNIGLTPTVNTATRGEYDAGAGNNPSIVSFTLDYTVHKKPEESVKKA
jgi:hypothetical protein